MKYAHKLMVVPYVPRIENPAETQIFTLDEEMESILSDKTKSIDDKIKLYNQTLSKYNKTLENFNLSNAAQNDNYVETMASQVADKTYSKFKPDIDNLKNKQTQKIITKKIFRIGPGLTTKKRRVKQEAASNEELYKTMNEDLYKTAIDDPNNELSENDDEEEDEDENNIEPKTSILNSALKNDTFSEDISKKKVTIATSETEKLFEVKTSSNGKQYIVPPRITEDAFVRMQEAAPNGVNTDDIIKHMKSEGKIELFKKVKSQIPQLASRERNNFFISINKEFKLQDGQGLKSQWAFKKFF